ncbi:MAG: alpha-amylase [Bacteroidetes bacterium]|nr:alpha-amylase [Bacteroidota bacterium]
MNTWSDKIFYEIFVQSFADSNGDGIGDLPGLTQRLDYLAELGIDAIWLMPVHPSPSYHKYDVVDYYGIHPDYGTMEDFKEFLHQAHQRGLKVILDLVVNHTSHLHPWFIESQKGPDNPYREYYIWRDLEEVKDEISKKELTTDSDNLTQWHQSGDDPERYYGFFWHEMPDLNFDSPKVREEVFKIGEFWLREVGVDGFRLDAAGHLYPDDRAEDAHAFWREFTQRMQAIKPDVYIVGEVWGESEKLGGYLQGLPSLFHFSLGEEVIRSLKEGQPYYDRGESQAIRQLFDSPDVTEATLLSNHDQNRIMSEVDGDIARAKLAANILFTLPGAPFIYYGEELGMKGKKPDERIREPFVWDEEGKDPLQCTWEPLIYNQTDSTPPLAMQRLEGHSLWNHYRLLIALRKSLKSMHKGKLEVLNDYSYLIKGEDTIFIAHNLDNTQRKIIIPEPFARKEEAFLLPALSTVVGYEIGGSFYLKLLPDWVYIDLNEEGSN